jgi:hypothetical protein
MLGRWRGWVAVVFIGAAVAGVHGCQGMKRPFADGDVSSGVGEGSNPPDQETGSLLPGDASAGQSEGQPAVNFRAQGSLGSQCAVGEGCDSGFCVGGRCCESACDGVCEACSEGGRCQLAPADDDRCAVITCEVGATTCATYAESQATNRCQSPGVCKTACDPVTVAIDTLCAEVAPGINGVCNEAGNCVDPRSAFGAACQSDIDCAEGTCIDGVCCSEACNGACESCDATGACVADASGSSCGEGLACFGRGACLSPNGAVCQTAAECGSGNCEAAVGGGSACCAAPCANGLLCNGDGACISPESDLGTACTDDTQCIGGRCFDGVCCDSECGGPCEACNAAGQEGRCSAAPTGSADPLCQTGRQCAGRGQCLLALGAACTLNGDCRSGECGAALQGANEICCEAVCVNGQRCGANGSCVDAPRADGNTCTANTDCLSNSCVNGRCCESACNGTCQACSGLGDCNVSPGNDPRCAPIDCPTSNTVCVTYPADVATNLCGSFGACRTAQQECQPRFASSGTACENVAPGVRGICDGAGTCRDPRVPLGSACGVGTDCTSGFCSFRLGGGTVCCNAACGGLCEACSSNGSCDLRDLGACPPGQECASRTTCAPRSVSEGQSCAGGEACSGGGRCIGGLCRGPCVLAANGASGSRYNECVLAQ